MEAPAIIGIDIDARSVADRFRVQSASTLREGLELARRTRPHAIVARVLAPSLEGFRLALVARRDPALRDVRVVLVAPPFARKAEASLALKVGATLIRDLEELALALALPAKEPAADAEEAVALYEREGLVRRLEQLEARNHELELRAVEADMRLGVSEEATEDYRQLAGNLDTLFYIRDVETGKCVYASPALERFFGVTHEAVYADMKVIYQAIHPEDRARVEAAIPGQARGPCDETYRVIAGGRERWVRSRAYPVRDQDGKVRRVAGFVEDVNDLVLSRKLNEARVQQQAAVARLGRFALECRDLQPLLDEAAEIARTTLGSDFSTVKEGGTVMTCRSSAGWSRDLRGERVALDASTAGRVFTSGKPVVMADLASGAVEVFREHGVRSCVVVPVLVGGASAEAGDTPWGTLSVLSRATRSYTPDDVHFAQSIANIIGAFVAKKRADEALEQSSRMLRHSQKLEAVGRLAGGIAHDFNNLLTATLGYAELALMRLGEGDPLRRDLLEIQKASLRAKALTHQLLVFSRRETNIPRIVDVNAVVKELERMLGRLIGEDVELSIETTDVAAVKIDPGHLEQIITNLVVNARDAMPEGGKVAIRTRNVVLDGKVSSLRGTRALGPHVELSVADTGCGMSESTLARIFEPFFTTKEAGKGTGLGLSMVWGIVEAAGGSIDVESKVGTGTLFRLYLPAVAKPVEADAPGSEPANARGNESILIVEDDELVRTLLRLTLEQQGYTVTVARNGEEALASTGRFDLLLSDVVLPRMGGPATYAELRKRQPSLPAIFCSGYTGRPGGASIEIPEGTTLIHKPFTPPQLARTVREVLDKARAEPRARCARPG